MVEEMQYREEAAWETLRGKTRKRFAPHKKRAALPILLTILGVLCLGICAVAIFVTQYSRPLTLPDSVSIQGLTAAHSQELRAADFVQGLEGTDIQVAFGQDYDEKLLGQQEITLIFTRGYEICARQVPLYRFHLEPSLTVKLGEETRVDVRDFVADENISVSFVNPLEEGACGIFTLQLLCGDREYSVECTVAEAIPPQGTGKTVKVEAGTVPEPSAFVENIQDHTPVTVTYKEQQRFVQAGLQKLTLVLTDLFGNTSEVTAMANVVPAANGPQFAGLNTIYLEQGAAVSYKTGVTATDAQDGELSFTVDTGNFDNRTVGHYTVLYSATDSDGNTLIVPRDIVVESHTGQLVRERARAVLDRIIQSGMSRDEQIKAVFTHVRYNVYYTGNSDKSSIENAAYEGFTKGAGDCYTYYAMVRVMLDMLEIENIEVTRIGGTSRHWWNLVLFEDGRYYHVDASPQGVRVSGISPQKMTEANLVTYTNDSGVVYRRPNYYVYDRSLPEYQNIDIAQ